MVSFFVRGSLCFFCVLNTEDLIARTLDTLFFTPHARVQTYTGESRTEAPAHRDVYGFKLDGKVDWETYSAWQV